MSEPVKQARCCGWTGRIFGHRFEARFSTETTAVTPFTPPPIDLILSAMRSTPSDEFTSSVIEAVASAYHANNETQTYIYDVCTRCGQVIKQQD